MLENLTELHSKYNKSTAFKLNLVLTKEGGQRLQESDILETIGDYKYSFGRINKLWVCGPPPMSAQFQKLLPEISKAGGLSASDYLIL
jgi:hypothetical protein